MSEVFLPGEAPKGDQGLDNEVSTSVRPHKDSDIQKILIQIQARQAAQKAPHELSAADLAFALMRQVPREHWNTPLSKMGHWPRGSSIKEIKSTPRLLDYTPAQAILQLFEMDDKARRDQSVGN